MHILAAIKARRKKARKAATQAEPSIEQGTSGCKSIGRLCGARSCRRAVVRFIGCWQKGDCEGGEEEMGKD
jgi:hypothetical protein